MPSFIRNTSGGKAISGGALAPRSRRGNSTDQVASYWSGGGASVTPTVEYLVVAGGGAGGNSDQSYWSGGGGGGGGYRCSVVGEQTGGNGAAESVYTIVAGVPITVTVGGGSASSVFGSITSTYGGSGAFGHSGYAGGAGGSGGGANLSEVPGGIVSPTQGFIGGWSGGGGGASGAGPARVYGGPGKYSSITGSSVPRSGGGGAGTQLAYSTAGGVGGGGAGGSGRDTYGTAGTEFTGGGGGGSSTYGYYRTGGAGGSGIVIIRYPDSFPEPASTTGSPSVSVAGGYRIYQWTGSGSVTF